MDTPFKKNIFDCLSAKGLSESSIKLYLRHLEKLNEDTPLKNFKFLMSPETIVNKLVDYKPNTKKSYLIAITAILNSCKEDNKMLTKLYEKYNKLMIETANQIKSTPSEEKSNEQKENWVEWSKVEEKFKELQDKVNLFINSKKINQLQYQNLLDFVILSLYTLIPPRRNEYQKMFIVKKFSPDLDIDKNYYCIDDGIMVYNVYKTAKKYGQQTIKLPTELRTILNNYLKFHPLIKGKKLTTKTEVPLLVHFDGSPLDKINAITRTLNKIFEKKIGSSMLRHIFLSNKYGDTLEEQKEDADMMAHSVDTQKQYIKL
jgi:hypothetical protein